MCRDVEAPGLRPRVEVATTGVAGTHPEVDVLAVAVGRQTAREHAARVRSERSLDDREHAVGGEEHPLRPRRQVVHDPFHGHDRAPAGCQRAPHTLEQRGVEGDVAGVVRHHAMDERHVGRERGQQPDGPER